MRVNSLECQAPAQNVGCGHFRPAVRLYFEKPGCRNIISYQRFVMFSSVDKLGDIFVRNIVSYQCFVLFSSVDKLGNIFVRNIVSYQCFVIFLSVDKLGDIFVRNIVSYQCFVMFPSVVLPSSLRKISRTETGLV